MDIVKPYFGVALMTVGALLLLVCKLAGWQTNAELLIGLVLIILGFILHVWQQKRGEKY
jgi:glucose uptake protein GlcU